MVLLTPQSTGRLLGAGSALGGFTADSRAGPAQGQSLLRTRAVLVLVLTTPSNTGRLQAELKTQPLQDLALLQLGAGSHPSAPGAGSGFPSSQQMPAQPQTQGFEAVGAREGQVSLRSPSAQGVLQPSHQAHILSGLKSPEQGLCTWSCPRLTAPQGRRLWGLSQEGAEDIIWEQ